METIKERLERYAADNLNDGEYPIPEEGRMVQLSYAVEVLSGFYAQELTLLAEKIELPMENEDAIEASDAYKHAAAIIRAHAKSLEE